MKLYLCVDTQRRLNLKTISENPVRIQYLQEKVK